jgi:hypothetical protein
MDLVRIQTTDVVIWWVAVKEIINLRKKENGRYHQGSRSQTERKNPRRESWR